METTGAASQIYRDADWTVYMESVPVGKKEKEKVR
jgi:hypothetical protein